MKDPKTGRFVKGERSKEMLKKISETNKGNKHGIKLKEQDVRQEAYKQYCEWIANGWSKEAFVFEHPEFSVSFKTMERYIRENPHEFPAKHKEDAESKSYKVWEQTGRDMMVGKIKGCQPAIYQMFMRNKFGWDKESRVTHSVEPEARRLLEKLEE